MKKEIQKGITLGMSYENAFARLEENLGLGTGKPISKYHTFARINSRLKAIFESLPNEVKRGASTS